MACFPDEKTVAQGHAAERGGLHLNQVGQSQGLDSKRAGLSCYNQVTSSQRDQIWNQECTEACHSPKEAPDPSRGKASWRRR